MRYWVPVYIALVIVSITIITNPSTDNDENLEEVFTRSIEHGQKFGLVLSIIGSTMTVKEILDSRNKIKNNNQG